MVVEGKKPRVGKYALQNSHGQSQEEAEERRALGLGSRAKLLRT